MYQRWQIFFLPSLPPFGNTRPPGRRKCKSVRSGEWPTRRMHRVCEWLAARCEDASPKDPLPSLLSTARCPSALMQARGCTSPQSRPPFRHRNPTELPPSCLRLLGRECLSADSLVLQISKLLHKFKRNIYWRTRIFLFAHRKEEERRKIVSRTTVWTFTNAAIYVEFGISCFTATTKVTST